MSTAAGTTAAGTTAAGVPDATLGPTGDRRRGFASLAVLLVALSSVPLLWPGDAPWISDEPRLLEQALDVARHGSLPAHGLTGTAGAAYGPVPLILYRLALGLTHDLVSLVWLRALLVTACSALALYWLARSCSALRPALGALALLSPYLWFYSRALWDNTFLIPLSALMIAAYVSFCHTPRRWKLALVVLCGTLAFLTHLMVLSVLGAIGLHALWRMRAALAQQRAFCIGALGLALIVSLPYLSHLLEHAAVHRAREGSLWEGVLFPVLGGRVLSALGFEYFLGANWEHAPGPLSSTALVVFNRITWGTIPLVWSGVWVALRTIRAERNGAARQAGSELSRLLLLALVLQGALSAGTATFMHPHYYNGAWLIYFALIWLALSACGRAGVVLGASLGVAQAVVLAHIISSVHETHGNRRLTYGPTLGTQLGALERMQRFDPRSEVRIASDVSLARNPHALAVLQRFYPQPPAATRPRARLHIEYATSDPRYGQLTVRVLPGAADAGAQR